MDLDKAKYEGALTQSAAKEQGTSQFGNHLIFWKWFIMVLRTTMNFELYELVEMLEKNNSVM